tara:strand:- start:34 stop:555 length:522 start_codon:yes stop_codon:yes gene_type:complete
MQALFEGLGAGAAQSLGVLSLISNNIGPAGAETLAAALHRGAMPKIEELYISFNPIGNQGMASLTAALRKMTNLSSLGFSRCNIGDEGVASLVADLGKDDFKALQGMTINNNRVTDAGFATLTDALKAGALPMLKTMTLDFDDNHPSAVLIEAQNPASKAAKLAVHIALNARL